MRKQLLGFSFLFALISVSLFTSCSKDEIITTDSEVIWNYTDEAMFSLQERGNLGRNGCFELVFPITIAFPDASTQEVDSYETLRDAIFAWKEANPDATDRPSFEFPVEVLSEEGEVISVADEAELRDLGRECRRNFFGQNGHRGHRHRCNPCFDLVFPLSIAFPDGTTLEVADRADMKDARYVPGKKRIRILMNGLGFHSQLM